MNFILSNNTQIQTEVKTTAVTYAVKRMMRDMEMVLYKTQLESDTFIQLVEDCELPAEAYKISFPSENILRLVAADELGFVYGLFFLSEQFLGITPFWFWNDQTFSKVDTISIPINEYVSPSPVIRYRGWFINDEVLLATWKVSESTEKPWEMAFEALLRCGGNMVIPGTDKNSKKYRKLASDMGLWITHHHAEPLGAEMFARAFPELNPSYAQHPDLFHKLWEQAIKEQKDMKIIWNLGFRGQGDCPFWETDSKYDTPESRGELISSLIEKQYQMLKKHFDSPVCCTNLYGETMELYKDGYIHFSKEIIKIWADNGYGKMVSRRQGNSNPRVYALPNTEVEENGHHGLYYHVSFYDLQAANHITMLPNSIEFVNKELHLALSKGTNDYLIVNCSNIRPHVFYLDAIRKIWYGEEIESIEHARQYVNTYYKCQEKEEIAECFTEYAKCMLSFGTNEDEHAGEQFYNYSTRNLASQWMRDRANYSTPLIWATGKVSLEEQVNYVQNVCKQGQKRMEGLFEKCTMISDSLSGNNKSLSENDKSLSENDKSLSDDKLLFDATIYLQVKIHLYCLYGTCELCNGYITFAKEDYLKAFYQVGKATTYFQEAEDAMRASEYEKWVGFYANDCLTDIKSTAYLLKNLMGYIRNIGDGPHFYGWQRQVLYSQEDLRVMLITNNENHITNEELYEAMKLRE